MATHIVRIEVKIDSDSYNRADVAYDALVAISNHSIRANGAEVLHTLRGLR